MPCASCANAPVGKISRRPGDKYSHGLRSLCAPVSKIQKEHISLFSEKQDPRQKRHDHPIRGSDANCQASKPRTRIVKQSCLEKNTKSKLTIARETLRVRKSGEFEEHQT
ncbi:hypothetical protein NDU88_004123 [Pleurodeles waltl]|uniref:Uncharacterized protein n=1 Tax=Pleurodeles waltl TaxID=8319 RepID=A0AAV7UEP0_PLEWA|nr:hypothetical protein NDU88_004123 [Pleurodeles waltl]